MHQCNVLIVDDDLGMRDTLGLVLKANFNVEAVANAEDALFALERKVFDVVLCDIVLPTMNGIELLKIIKRQWPSTAVIVITVIDDVSVAVESMKIGAYTYMTKNFEYDALNTLVSDASGYSLGTRQLNQPLREENLTLRKELAQYRSASRVPVRLEERRVAKSDRRRMNLDDGTAGELVSSR